MFTRDSIDIAVAATPRKMRHLERIGGLLRPGQTLRRLIQPVLFRVVYEVITDILAYPERAGLREISPLV